MMCATGVARGVFSNQAGLGSTPIAHSTARTDHPVRQGGWGLFEVFTDTIILCALIALAIPHQRPLEQRRKKIDPGAFGHQGLIT